MTRRPFASPRPRCPATSPRSAPGSRSASTGRSRSARSARRSAIEPAVRGALDVVASAPGTSTYVFTPSEVLATETPYSVGLGPAARRIGRARRRDAGLHGHDDLGPRRRPLPPDEQHRQRRARLGPLGPVHGVDGPQEHEAAPGSSRPTASRSPAPCRSPRRTRSSCSGRPRRCRTGPSSRCSSRTPPDRRPARRSRPPRSVRFRVQAQRQGRDPGARHDDEQHDPARQLRRRLGRRRQLGRGRDVLPAADELHPDRRLGHLVGQLLEPRRPQRQGPLDRQRHQLEGQPAVREATRDRAASAATSSAATPATGSAPRATRATSGPRTSAAARATRTARSSGRTSSSRASGRTTAATT